jgi:hypothetical protein
MVNRKTRASKSRLIPIRGLKYNLKVRKIRHGFHVLRIINEHIERMTQNICQDVKRRENTIMEVFLSNIVPNMFNGIHLRRIGGLGNQANIFWNHQRFCMVPARLVNLHHQEIVGKSVTHVLYKQIHHFGIRGGKN